MSEDCPELQKGDVITTKSPQSLWNGFTVLKTPWAVVTEMLEDFTIERKTD